MVPGLSSRPSTSCFPGCAISSPTALTLAPTCATPSLNSATGPSRSSNAPLTRLDFNCSHGDGSSNEPLLGSIETAAWQRTSRLRSRALRPGFTSPPCSYSLGDWLRNNTTYEIKIRTLSNLLRRSKVALDRRVKWVLQRLPAYIKFRTNLAVGG